MSDQWFGLQPPAGAEIAWGARAIRDEGPRGVYWLSFVPDRVSHRGGIDDLYDWFQKAARVRVEYAMTDPHSAEGHAICDGRSRTVVGYDDGEYHFRACPNGSYGYVYMVAWVGETDDRTCLPLT